LHRGSRFHQFRLLVFVRILWFVKGKLWEKEIRDRLEQLGKNGVKLVPMDDRPANLMTESEKQFRAQDIMRTLEIIRTFVPKMN
jgi:hypothetical protein